MMNLSCFRHDFNDINKNIDYKIVIEKTSPFKRRINRQGSKYLNILFLYACFEEMFSHNEGSLDYSSWKDLECKQDKDSGFE